MLMKLNFQFYTLILEMRDISLETKTLFGKELENEVLGNLQKVSNDSLKNINYFVKYYLV